MSAQEHRSTGAQEHRSTGAQEHRSTGAQEHRSTGAQEHRSTGAQEHRSTGAQGVISVIIPTYRREPELVIRAVDSVLAQTYKDYEIILVDDNAAARDISYREQIADMVSQYGNNKINYLQNEKHLGGALARNAGIGLAKGEYTAFLDDDDWFVPEKLEKQMAYILQNNLDFCTTDVTVIDEQGNVQDMWPDVMPASFDTKTLMKTAILKGLGQTSSLIVRTSVLRALNGFDDVPSRQDQILVIKIIASGAKTGYLKEPLGYWYRSDTNNAISVFDGPNSIPGTKLYMKFLKKHLHYLTFKERRHINFHNSRFIFSVACARKEYWQVFVSVLYFAIFYPVRSLKRFFFIITKGRKKK